MEHEFWLQRWASGNTGFHQDEVNPYLTRYWHSLEVPSDAVVFVPLCGKSRDMQWLHSRGHAVVGVELSRLALEVFFREGGLAPTETRTEPFEVFRAQRYTLYQGDFFDLTREELQDVDVVYDRASLIALPPEMRVRYSRHLIDIVPRRAVMLVITLEYPQIEMAGPPFSVDEEEVRRLYEAEYAVERLADDDVLALNGRLRDRGISRLREKVYRLAPR